MVTVTWLMLAGLAEIAVGILLLLALGMTAKPAMDPWDAPHQDMVPMPIDATSEVAARGRWSR